jgi:hypothetical protein
MKLTQHQTKDPVLNEDQKRFLLKNHKIMSVEALAKHFGITVKQTKTQCSRLYCGYFSENAA